MEYRFMSRSELMALLALQKSEFDNFKHAGLKLDMSRGIPGADQLDLSQDMMSTLATAADCISDGKDYRSYGMPDGTPEAKVMFSSFTGAPAQNIVVCGNSSLNIMFDTVARNMLLGVSKSAKPWSKQGEIKFLCPVPGYDRHFAVCETLGIKMVNIPMTSNGPDMDAVENAVRDPLVKGIWCVPKYSNPEGITFSDETVHRFAALKPAADDFRIFWDNAYIVHDLYDEGDKLLDIFAECEKTGNSDLVYMFVSTSKISFPGAGVAAVISSPANTTYIKSVMAMQTICHDKLNQLRHARYFDSAEKIYTHMKKHAALLRPKFSAVCDAFERELAETGVADWNRPRGGYFISLNISDGCAKKVYNLMNELGVKLTPAGATFPYGFDPHDRNLRIAPTYPNINELTTAVNALCVCVKIACIEKLLG
jgi:Transcriptional regulators containing a DNA-binding HTH domain and an aminotransferase domain (MocR family) and their eukaryotic orthologs